MYVYRLRAAHLEFFYADTCLFSNYRRDPGSPLDALRSFPLSLFFTSGMGDERVAVRTSFSLNYRRWTRDNFLGKFDGEITMILNYFELRIGAIAAAWIRTFHGTRYVGY